MPKLYIMKGLPASGKTTYCRTKLAHAVRVNRDSLRWMIYGTGWNPKREYDITVAEDVVVSKNLQMDRDVVVDATNLNERTLDSWHNMAEACDAKVEVIDLTSVPPWTCVENDRKRPQPEQVGPDVIWEKYYKYLAPKPYTGDQTLTPIIISDLDGTVRDNSWRDPFDMTGKCIDDPARWSVIHAIKGIQASNEGSLISFMSGMEYTEANYSATAKWLARYFCDFTLVMRFSGDHRRDSEVKREMFEKVRPNPVLAVFDDRPQVIRECWVPLGLYDRIFSVGMPGLEF